MHLQHHHDRPWHPRPRRPRRPRYRMRCNNSTTGTTSRFRSWPSCRSCKSSSRRPAASIVMDPGCTTRANLQAGVGSLRSSHLRLNCRRRRRPSPSRIIQTSRRQPLSATSHLHTSHPLSITLMTTPPHSSRQSETPSTSLPPTRAARRSRRQPSFRRPVPPSHPMLKRLQACACRPRERRVWELDPSGRRKREVVICATGRRV